MKAFFEVEAKPCTVNGSSGDSLYYEISAFFQDKDSIALRLEF